jgi:HEAT repeat protein
LRLVAPSRGELLFAALEKSPSRKVRRTVLEVLAGVGPAVLPQVRERFAATEWFVVRNMVTLAARVGANVHELSAAARHPHPKVRLEVARAMRTHPEDPRAADVLSAMLLDPSEEVRVTALAGLAEVSMGASAAHSIEASILDDDQGDDLRRRALDALGTSTSDEAAAALYRLLEPRGLLERPLLTELRERAATALRRSRAAAAAGLFQRALQSPTWRVRKACEKAAEERRG